jgi:hypothetical protein
MSTVHSETYMSLFTRWAKTYRTELSRSVDGWYYYNAERDKRHLSGPTRPASRHRCDIERPESPLGGVFSPFRSSTMLDMASGERC